MARLLSVKRTAEELGIGRDSTYKLIKAGLLPMVRIGRVFKVPAEGIDAFIREAEIRGGGRGA